MLWSRSSYLPAHKDGQKYIDMAYRLEFLLEGRLFDGKSLSVLILEPTKVKSKRTLARRGLSRGVWAVEKAQNGLNGMDPMEFLGSKRHVLSIVYSFLRIYDQFSDWERSFDLVASNSSYRKAAPSRVGAFEVHLVQGVWDPKLCLQPLLDGESHWGPPINGSSGILCTACSERLQGRSCEPFMHLEQHSLLHSKRLRRL